MILILIFNILFSVFEYNMIGNQKQQFNKRIWIVNIFKQLRQKVSININQNIIYQMSTQQPTAMPFEKFLQLVPTMESTSPDQLPTLYNRFMQIFDSYACIMDITYPMALYKTTQFIMRLKQTSEAVSKFSEALIINVIQRVVRSKCSIGIDCLRFIFDVNNEYYKHHFVDKSLEYPLGYSRSLDKSFQPTIGQQCDVVKPYITSSSFCNWTRCILLEKQGKSYLLQYANSSAPTNVKQRPFFAPLGSRTPDFNWRMHLTVGSRIDAMHERSVWYSSTVVEEKTEYGVKKVRVSFRKFDDHGDRKDFEGNVYFGLGPNEDEWMDVLSPRIQAQGKMHRKLCYYSSQANEVILDDSYDLLFQKEHSEKPINGLMRLIFMRSTAFLTFYNKFCQEGGHNVFSEYLENPDYNKDVAFSLMVIIGNTSFMVPRMAVYQVLAPNLAGCINYLKQICKQLNPMRIDMALYYLNCISGRCISLTEKYTMLTDFKKFVVPHFLTQNLQKQLLALKILYDLVNPYKPYNSAERKDLIQYFKENQIFYSLLKAGVHDQILQRSTDFIKMLLPFEVITEQQLDYLWNLMPPSDLRGRAIVQKMFADFSKNLPLAYVKNLIDKILDLKETDLTVDNLNLLRQLKNRQDIPSTYQMKIWQYLWDVISRKSMNITRNIEEEVEKVFRSLITILKDASLRIRLLKLMCSRLSEITKINTEISLMKEYILSFPKSGGKPAQKTAQDLERLDQTKSTEVQPMTIKEVIMYLRTQNIYQTLLTLLNNEKNKDKSDVILEFISFLFSYDDDDDINQIVKTIYQKTGPNDSFLTWAKSIDHRAKHFFIQLLETKDPKQFVDLTPHGWNCLKNILLDINAEIGNLKVLHSTKTSVSISVDTSIEMIGPVQGPSTEKQLKNEHKVFIYTLKSPTEIKGIKFLEELLFIAKDSTVYSEVTKLLIGFIVNLDSQIAGRAKQFTESFLLNIVSQIAKINRENVYDPKVKVKLETYISFILQILGETERDGLQGIHPHFQNILGDNIELKFENLFGKQQLKQFSIVINQNSTLWTLKKRLADILHDSVQKIDVIKYKDPMSDNINGKSVGNLFFNGQTLKVDKKSVKQIPKHDLLNSDKSQLTATFCKIVQDWFKQYNQYEQMGLKQLKKLGNECWKGSALKDEKRLKEIVQKFDLNQKGYLTLQEFKNFFVSKSVQNPSAIWRILNLSGFRNDFKHKDEPQLATLSSSIQTRKLLSQDHIYQTLFQLLQNITFEPLHLDFYRLIGVLQTNKNLKEQLLANPSQGLKKCKGKYQLAYTLEIILLIIQSDQNQYLNFYRGGGCCAIIELLDSKISPEGNIYKEDALLRMFILPNMLKILSYYIYPLNFHIKTVAMIQDWKMNLLEVQQLQKKISAFQEAAVKKHENEQKQEMKAQDVSKSQRLNLELRKYPQMFDLHRAFQVVQKLYMNLVAFYSSQFLQKITSETTKILAVFSTQSDFPINSYIFVVKSQSLNLRRGGHNFIYLHLRQYQNKVSGFLNELIIQIPNENKHSFSNFFNLLSKILQKAMQQIPEDEPFIKLTNDLFKKLYAYNCTENRRGIMSDKILLGIMLIIKTIFTTRQTICKLFADQKHLLVQRYLFFYRAQQKIKSVKITPQMLKTEAQPQIFENYVQCKSDDCRKILYEIIFYMHKASAEQDPQFFSKMVSPILQQLKQPKKGGFKTTSVGLTNFGSTCYMNSMLQVLNSISPFRNSLMKQNIDNPLVTQMKNLFSHLFFSQRNDYGPKSLLNAFNPPINPGLQQDTTQFLNYLFDQLEHPLKNTNFDSILNQTFRGSQETQMICHSCKKRRQRDQTFFTYSVDIEGKYKLGQALEAMHQGQVITECLCENCGERADTTKRSVINQIPNVFFLHLRRIVFNYDMFVNTKIHTRLQFPNELNFEPYTKEGIDLREKLGIQYLKRLNDNEEEAKKFEEMALHGKQKDFYKLQLKGVIVHSGSADVGHYIAIVKKDNGWIKFDDARVTLFTLSSFDSDCYGGNWTSDEWGGCGSSANAYVLVYEKVVKKPIKIESNGVVQQIPFQKFDIYNDQDHYRQVWLDNHQLMLENQLISDSYCKDFLHFCCKILQASPKQNKIQIIAQILSKVSVHSGQIGDLQDLFNNNLGQITPDSLTKFIISEPKTAFNILFHFERRIREFMSRFIQGIIIVVYKQGDPQLRSQIIQFLDNLLGQLHGQVAKNWMRIDGYLRLFKRIVLASVEYPQLYAFVLGYSFITKYIDFIMEKSSPLTISHKKYSIGTKTNPVNFSSALETISFLVKRSYGLNGQNYQVPPIPKEQLFHFSDNDVICLSHIAFYEKMIRERQNCVALGQILQRMCIRNVAFSEAVSRSMLKCINQNTDANDQMKDMLQCVCQVLKIRDEYWTNRAEFILGYSTPYINDSNSLSSIEDQRFIYASTLDDLFPVQCLFTYAYNNRLRFPLAITHIVSTMLKACSVSDQAMLFMARQVSPSYVHTRYIDWIKPFLQNVLGFVNLSEKSKQELQKQINNAKQYLKDIEQFADKNQQKMYVPLIAGTFESLIIENNIQTENVQVTVKKATVYCHKSQPNHNGNTAIDQFLEHGRVQKPVNDKSNILKLFKMSKPAIALKLNPVQQAEQKQIVSLFDQEPNPNQKKTQMDVEKPIVEHTKNSKQEDSKNSEIEKPQINKQKTEKQAEKQEMEEEWPLVNIPNLFTCDYFKQIEITNKTDSQLNVTLRFDKSQKVNTILPSKISFLVTNKTTDSMWLFKQKPDEEWGDIKFSIQVNPVNKNVNLKSQQPAWYKTYGQRARDQAQDKQNMDKQEVSQQMEVEQPQLDDFLKYQNAGQILCPVCTYANVPGMLTCEVCDSSLQ